MAPVLFNLYARVFVEHWLTRVENSDGVGASLKYKHDWKLFRKYTHNAEETKLTEFQFAEMQPYLPEPEKCRGGYSEVHGSSQ